MRTTIELDDEVVAKLRQLAAIQGKRGYSELINEAVENYLREHTPRRTAEQFVDPFEGVWTDEEAKEVRARIKESRKTWRRSWPTPIVPLTI